MVRLKASGISLLTASVTVYDSYGRVVASAVSTDPLEQRPHGAASGRACSAARTYVKVDGAGQGVFDVGGYKLAVDFLSLGGLLAPITSTVGAVLDGHTDDVLAHALGLTAPSTTDSRFDAIYRGVIEDSADVDTYRVKTRKFAAGTAVTLNVMVWGLDGNPLDPRLRIFDAAGNPVAFQVLANDAGLFSVQVPNAVAGRDYFVQVAARTPGGANDTGSYFVAADFNRIEPLEFDGVASGTVDAGQTENGIAGDRGCGRLPLRARAHHVERRRDHDGVRRERDGGLHADGGIRQAGRHRDALPGGRHLHRAVLQHVGGSLEPGRL